MSLNKGPELSPDDAFPSTDSRQVDADYRRKLGDNPPANISSRGPELAPEERFPMNDDADSEKKMGRRRPSNGLDYSSTSLGPSSRRKGLHHADDHPASRRRINDPMRASNPPSAPGAFMVIHNQQVEPYMYQEGSTSQNPLNWADSFIPPRNLQRNPSIDSIARNPEEEIQSANVTQVFSEMQDKQGKRRKKCCIGIVLLLFLVAAATGLGVGLGISKSSPAEPIAQTPSSSPTVSSYPTMPAKEWMQVGQRLDGSHSMGEFGQWLSLSGDGSTLGVSATQFEDEPAYIRMYRIQESNWTQVGETLYQPTSSIVDLSFDGSRMIVATASTPPSSPGQVQMYSWNGTTWTPLGEPIVGEGSAFAKYSCISGDGSVVAVSDYQGSSPDGPVEEVGHVFLFRFNEVSEEWVLLGQTIYGDAAGDRMGSWVSLSFDGSVVAAGATESSGSGYLRVYELSPDKLWIQRGSDLRDAAGTHFGARTSLSYDGNVVAVGDDQFKTSSRRAGSVHVFAYDGVSWSQRGDTIEGESLDVLGFSVSVNEDGSIVAIGAPRVSVGSDQGYVRVIQWTQGSWVDLGSSVVAHQSQGSDFGYSVSISADGRTLAVGDPRDAGTARVYEVVTL